MAEKRLLLSGSQNMEKRTEHNVPSVVCQSKRGMISRI